MSKAKEQRVSNSVLGRAYQRGLGCQGALMVLLNLIKSHDFKPSFSKKEAESLFNEDVLKQYGAGRYYHNKTKLATLEDWTDLINNIATPLLGNLQLLTLDGLEEINKVPSYVKIQKNTVRLKVVEDWLYYHKKIIPKII
ncbi:MAG: hypothetical protein ABIH69_01420 [bacterium]